MRIHERSRPTDDTIFAPTRQGRSAPPTAVAGAAASALQSKNIRSLPINCPFYRKFLTEPSGHDVFKTVTTDNGSEFTMLHELEDERLNVYFTHPYTSCEKGSNECHNRMLRRFLPKGRSVGDYTADDICFFADCINGLPRKILHYATPEALFEAELDRIYAA